MDHELLAALEPILRDLRTAGIAAPLIEEKDWTRDPDRPSAMLRSPDGSGRGVSVERTAPQVEAIAHVADQVQEWAIEQLWGRAATNWPACPEHPHHHPLKAATRGALAVWVCPADETVVAKIGTLK